MLTKTQLAMLEKRKNRELWESEDLDPKERKYIDFTLRHYIEKQFDSFGHLLQVLEVMPDSQIKSILTSEHMANLLKVVERAIEILPPAIVEPIEGEEGKYQTNRSYSVNFGSKLAGATNSDAWVHVTCPASADEIEYWRMFHFFKEYDVFNHVFKDLTQHPPRCTLKEFHRVILPSLNKTASQRGVLCKIEPVKSITGQPNEEWEEKSQYEFEQADELLNPSK